jgi:hypothetical protein
MSDDRRTLAETLEDAWKNGAEAESVEEAEEHAFDQRNDDDDDA